MIYWTPEDMLQGDYDCTIHHIMRQCWDPVTLFNCIGSPKGECHIVLLDGYECEYTLPDGTVYRVPDLSVIYTATGSEYRLRLHPTKANGCTIGICFGLRCSGNPLRLTEDVVFSSASPTARTLFARAYALSQSPAPIPAEYKSILYALLTELCQGAAEGTKRRHFQTIEVGYQYLLKHYAEDISVEELAEMCYITASWFRQAFRKYTGMSPADFRKELRMNRAAEYLIHTSRSVQQIAEAVGYGDTSQFIRHFKARYGTTPHRYRMAPPSSGSPIE